MNDNKKQKKQLSNNQINNNKIFKRFDENYAYLYKICLATNLPSNANVKHSFISTKYIGQTFFYVSAK